MEKTDISVGNLVDMVRNGELLLPEMQRQYVWSATRVRDLLDSLYRSYPSGSILVWETTQDLPTREFSVEQRKSPFQTYKLLLDGQQRLTSLTAVLSRQPVRVKDRKKPVDILFNLEHPEGAPTETLEVEDDAPALDLNGDDTADEEENGFDIQEQLAKRTFVVASKALLSIPTWIRVSEIFNESKSDWDILKPLGIKPDDEKYHFYCKRLQRVRNIKNYPYVMHVLERTRAYEEVTEIFVRVNSLGVKLRGSDLALAQITARWQNSLRKFEDYAEESDEKTGFTFEIGLLVRTMVVFATKQCRFRTVASLPVEQLQAAWEKSKHALDFAVNFLRTNADLEDESLLSSPLLIIPIAVYGDLKNYQLNTGEQKKLLQWVHIANAKGHYSRGSSETLLDTDLVVLFKGGSVTDLIDIIKQQFGRLYVEPADFAGKGIRNPLFPLAFLALKKIGAKDWWSGLGLSLLHKGKAHSIEKHHIFPKAVLRDAGVDSSLINEIANFAFVSGRVNRSIRSKPPFQYIPEIIEKQGKEILALQAVPDDPNLLKVESYEKFLTYRREKLAEAVNRLLGIPSPKRQQPTFDFDQILAERESSMVEFKSSARWDYKQNRPNPELEKAVIKTIAAFMNSSGGTLLLGINNSGEAIGLETDYKTLSKRPDRDGYEQFIVNLVCRELGSDCSAYIRILFHGTNGQEICAIRVEPTLKPIYIEDNDSTKMFIRAGNTSKPLNPKEAVEYAKEHWRTM